MSYAENTSVSVDKSRAEIEATLRRYGAAMFFSGWDDATSFIAFKMNDRHIKISMPLPSKTDKSITHKKDRYGYWVSRSEAGAAAEYEQRLRTKFRALLLTVKAKLESVESGIETFEQAFLAFVVLPDNTLVGDRVRALVDEAYRTGQMGNLLPAPGETEA